MKTTAPAREKTHPADTIKQFDPDMASLIEEERTRQQDTLNLIPSENYTSAAVRATLGTALNNKYSEGYPARRYYQGNQFIDAIENLAIDRAKELFGAEHVNVQPHSGSPANQAVFFATMEPGDTFLGLDLNSGGHLTHGSPVNFSGKIYNSISYAVDKTTEQIDINAVRKLAQEHKPKLIISGWTAYPREFDFAAFQSIAEEVDAIHLADISHIAGLIAGGAHPSPLPFTHIVSSTTHKTLRGPRGAMILSKEKYAKDIDKAVFPGIQGGPHDHSIAAKAVAFKEALTPEFKQYAQQVVANAHALGDTLIGRGIKLVTGGTDTHLILIDLRPHGIGLGREAAIALENAGIVTNANTVPFEPSSPFKPSGIRLGTPIMATRGMRENEMAVVGNWIADVIESLDNEKLHRNIRQNVTALCSQFPLE